MTEIYQAGPIDAEGCVISNFLLTDFLPAEQAAATIERDRLIMSARAGFNRKLLPFSIDQNTGERHSGGRYLFNTYKNAVDYANWCRHEFEIDGVLMFDRPDFAKVKADVYKVVAAEDFASVRSTQFVCRTELWSIEADLTENDIAGLWPALRDKALGYGHSALWFMRHEERGEIVLLTVFDRTHSAGSDKLDYASLLNAGSAESCASDWTGVTKRYDRSHWILNIWLADSDNKDDKNSLWPNSPPLPAYFL